MMREELIRCKGGLKQEWNFDIYKQAFYSYNCDKRSLLTTSGGPYPVHAMVVYSVVNPTNEIDCIEDTFEHYNSERKKSYFCNFAWFCSWNSRSSCKNAKSF